MRAIRSWVARRRGLDGRLDRRPSRRPGAIGRKRRRPSRRPVSLGRVALYVAAAALSLSCASGDPSGASGASERGQSLRGELGDAAAQALGRDLRIVREPRKELADAFASAFPQARALFVGETHYVEEHQALWGALIPALEPQGYRAFLQEGMAAWSWAVEDYVLGREAALPPEALIAWPGVGGFDARWLSAIREANLARPESRRQAFGYFDINHWREAFVASVRLLLKAVGAEAFGELARVLDASPDSPGYLAALDGLAGALERGAAFGLDGRALVRLRAMVRDERESAAIRQRWSDAAREAFMERKLMETLSTLEPDERLIVNCGLYHAQLDAAMGPTRRYVAERLAARPELSGRVSSLACVILRGEHKAAFMDRERSAIDLVQGREAVGLMRAIGLAAGEDIGFLPLGDPVWRRERVRVDWSGDPRRAAPGRQFSAILAYPRGSILRSTLALEAAD